MESRLTNGAVLKKSIIILNKILYKFTFIHPMNKRQANLILT